MTNTADNLQKAQAIRGSGYKTKVHELPVFKAWFDQEYRSGNKIITALRDEGLRLFPAYSEQIPSVTRLKNYADKYLTETVKVSPYAPNYVKQIENFDSYLKMHQLAKELWRRYEKAKQREELLNRPDGSFEWAQLYQKQLVTMLDFELKLGLRPFVASNPIYVQQNNYMQLSPPLIPADPPELSDAEMEQWLSEARKYRDETRVAS